ncbi:MAG: type II toxin-antitoxin system HicB family antitoxin [Gammaproteobacteria bacterium]|nr:type II toxin-antitoxin system HicB family antitoxin [Gammaproteobacteria bacterium]
MEYLVIVEKSDAGFGAYVPDLPGCVAVGDSRPEVIKLIREAIELHIEDMKERGDAVPPPSSQSELVAVHAA